MKGILLAGGAGTRLYPATKVISKHLMPIYDKPMIYYPLSILLMAGIKDILVISTPRDIEFYKVLFSDGQDLGIKIKYKIQENPRGIAEAFIIGEEFIGEDSVALVLGDNIFYGEELEEKLLKAKENKEGATIFAYYVDNPSAFGVVEFDEDNKVKSLEEKPKLPKSNYIVPGLYFYDNSVIDIAKNIKPSKRGEVEITTVNQEYLFKNKLFVQVFNKDTVWLDTGTYDSLIKASNFVKETQSKVGKYIGCIEEIAYKKEYISKGQLEKLILKLCSCEYRDYLYSLLK